jgi:hypothetical protein
MALGSILSTAKKKKKENTIFFCKSKRDELFFLMKLQKGLISLLLGITQKSNM